MPLRGEAVAEPATIEVVSRANQPVRTIDLPASVFGAPVKQHLLYEVVRMQLANRRAGTHATKTRGQVSGGGRKPWRQKGTGRARSGSSRSPIWVGGATIFGPQPRDYSYRLPSSARRAALCSALSAKLRDGQVKVVESLALEAPKTRYLAALLRDLGATKAVVLIPDRDDTIERAGRNLADAKVLRVAGANVYDLLRYEHLVTTQEGIVALVQRLDG